MEQDPSKVSNEVIRDAYREDVSLSSHSNNELTKNVNTEFSFSNKHESSTFKEEYNKFVEEEKGFDDRKKTSGNVGDEESVGRHTADTSQVDDVDLTMYHQRRHTSEGYKHFSEEGSKHRNQTQDVRSDEEHNLDPTQHEYREFTSDYTLPQAKYKRYYHRCSHHGFQSKKNGSFHDPDFPGRHKTDRPRLEDLDFAQYQIPPKANVAFIEGNIVTLTHKKLTKHGPGWERDNEGDEKVVVEESTTIEQRSYRQKPEDIEDEDEIIIVFPEEDKPHEVNFSPFQLQNFQYEKTHDFLLYNPRMKKKSWHSKSFRKRRARDGQGLNMRLVRPPEDVDKMRKYQLKNFVEDNVRDNLMYNPRSKRKQWHSRSFKKKQTRDLELMPNVRLGRTQSDEDRMRKYQLRNFIQENVQNNLIYHPRIKKKEWRSKSFKKAQTRDLELMPNIRLGRTQSDEDRMKKYQLDNFIQENVQNDLIYHPRTKKKEWRSQSFKKKQTRDVDLLPNVRLERTESDIERMRRFQLQNFVNDNVQDDLLYHPRSKKTTWHSKSFKKRKIGDPDVIPNVKLGRTDSDVDQMKRYLLENFRDEKRRDSMLYNAHIERRAEKVTDFSEEKVGIHTFAQHGPYDDWPVLETEQVTVTHRSVKPIFVSNLTWSQM